MPEPGRLNSTTDRGVEGDPSPQHVWTGEGMDEKCLCEPTEILMFPCSGGSNVGQIANRAAVELTQENVGKVFCLAGIGGHVSGLPAKYS